MFNAFIYCRSKLHSIASRLSVDGHRISEQQAADLTTDVQEPCSREGWDLMRRRLTAVSPDAVLSPHAWPLLLPLHYLMFPGCGGYSRGYLIPQLHHSGQQRCWSRTHGLIHSSHSAGPCPRHHLPLGARHRTHHAHHGRGKGARGLQAALWILLRYHVWLRKILSLWIMQRSSHPIRYHCIRLISIALPHTAQRHIIAFSSDEVMSLISWHATLLS